MKRSARTLVLTAWFVASGIFPALETFAAGETTLFVVPARYSVLQVMFDVLRRRDAYLMSYQGEPEGKDPVLHVWSGQDWRSVTLDDYREAQFLSSRPARVVLVGDAGVLPVSLATGAAQWGARVLNVEAMDPSSLVNAAGKLLEFDAADWRWFSARYNMQLTDTAESSRRGWYDQPYVETTPPESPWQIFRRKVLGKSAPAKRALPATDLEPVPPVEPPPLPEPVAIESGEPAEAGIK
jgi:hypothetical protein